MFVMALVDSIINEYYFGHVFSCLSQDFTFLVKVRLALDSCALGSYWQSWSRLNIGNLGLD